MEYGDFPSKGSLRVTRSILEKSLSLHVSEEDFKMKTKFGTLMDYLWFTYWLIKRLTKKTAPRSRVLWPPAGAASQAGTLELLKAAVTPHLPQTPFHLAVSHTCPPFTLSTPFLGCDAFPQSQISELSALSLDSTYCLCNLFGMFLLPIWIVSFLPFVCGRQHDMTWPSTIMWPFSPQQDCKLGDASVCVCVCVRERERERRTLIFLKWFLTALEEVYFTKRKTCGWRFFGEEAPFWKT